MNEYFLELSKIQSDNPVDKKVLLTQSRHSGNILLKRLAVSGQSLSNFTSATAVELAVEMIEDEIYLKGLSRISDIEQYLIIEKLLNEKPDLKYYTDLKTLHGITHAIKDAVIEIRNNASCLSELNKLQSTPRAKIDDLMSIADLYSRYLSANNLIDDAGILIAAAQKGTNATIICIDPLLRLSVLERDFIDKAFPEKIILQRPAVFGINPSRSALFMSSGRPGNPSFFSYLYAPGELLDINTPKTEFIHAVGIANEVRQALRQIVGSGEPFDSWEIACPDDIDYLFVLSAETARLQMPMTSFQGLPLNANYPISAIKAILAWIRGGYLVDDLYPLISYSDTIFAGRKMISVPGFAIAKSLRESGIGWGRKRYEEYVRSSKASEPLRSFISELLELVPEYSMNQMVRVSDIATTLKNILEHIIVSENDLQTGEALSSLFVSLRKYCDFEKSFLKAIDSITAEIDLLTGASASPEPGKVFISAFSCAGISGRPNLLILGLNEGTIPKRVTPDPIFSDIEKRQLGLQESTAKLRDNIFQNAVMLANHNGRTIFSCRVFDLLEWQQDAPASLMLQAYRLANHKPNAMYCDLTEGLGEPASFAPTTRDYLIDERDWWLSKARGTRSVISEALFSRFANLRQGRLAYDARNSDSFTTYDGLIKTKKGDNRYFMSATTIENFASCPRNYFFSKILRIRALNEIEYVKGRWLDPAARGILLHSVYCRFHQYVRGKLRDLAFEESALKKILSETIKEYADVLPIPSESAFKKEKAALENDILAFFDAEIKAKDKYFPRFFELSFGKSKGNNEGDFGVAETFDVQIMPRITLCFSGTIDRIDQDDKDDFIIIDYKTGSPGIYNNTDILNGGTQLQWAIYMLAAKEILQKMGERDPLIIKAEYYFPTYRAKGVRFTRNESRIPEAMAVLRDLAEILNRGLFFPYDDKGCRFCDHKAVCFLSDGYKQSGPGIAHMKDIYKKKRASDPAPGSYMDRIRAKHGKN